MGEDRQGRDSEEVSVNLYCQSIYKKFIKVYGRFAVKRPFSCYTSYMTLRAKGILHLQEA